MVDIFFPMNQPHFFFSLSKTNFGKDDGNTLYGIVFAGFDYYYTSAEFVKTISFYI